MKLIAPTVAVINIVKYKLPKLPITFEISSLFKCWIKVMI